MEGIGCVIALLVFLVPWLIRALSSSGDSYGYDSGVDGHIRRAQREGLTVRCTHDSVETDNGEQLPIARVEISGAIVVPYDNMQVMLRVWLLDVTEGEADAYAVFCTLPDMTDEDGLYTCDRESTIPYQFAEVSGMEVAVIPTFALLLPKQGDRRLKVCVAITDPGVTNSAYAQGSTLLMHTQQTAGYTEFKERTIKQERCMAMLALSISAVDGDIDPSETAVIRRFFSEHLDGRTDEEERKQRVTDALRETFNSLKQGMEQPTALIGRLCEEIREYDEPALSQAAYDLCVQVAAADEVFVEAEQEGLKGIARQLQLPDDYVREVHDRYFRMSMYEQADDEALLHMPSGLSRDEKIEFLNQEYRKWRSRAAHKDPAVATEANMRLQQITRARRELQEA